jgi:cell division protein ZapA
MRVICPHCLSKALITSSNRLSDQVTDLYCQCTNAAKCGASFVSTLAYKHVLNPPMRTTSEMAMSLVNRLSKEEKAELQRTIVR